MDRHRFDADLDLVHTQTGNFYTSQKVRAFFFSSQHAIASYVSWCHYVIMFNILDSILKFLDFFYFKLALLLVEMDTDSDLQALGMDQDPAK